MERIAGLIFSGFAIRLFGVGLALWVGVEVAGWAFDLIGQAAPAMADPR